MTRSPRRMLLAGVLIVLTACGAPVASRTEGTATAMVPTPVAETVAEDATTVPADDVDASPVTTVMRSLEVAGERFAAEGDPGAPITVIEFSDFG